MSIMPFQGVCLHCGHDHGNPNKPLVPPVFKELSELKQQLATTQRLLAESQARSMPSWTDGIPGKPWCEEWFIAETIYGDKVVLRALPEEYAYDFKTADDTYMKASNIKRWMQFPGSQYVFPIDAAIAKAKREALLEAARRLEGFTKSNSGLRHQTAKHELRCMADEVGLAPTGLKGGEQG